MLKSPTLNVTFRCVVDVGPQGVCVGQRLTQREGEKGSFGSPAVPLSQ